jgi:mannosyltransferase
MIKQADALIATSPEAQSFLRRPSALIPHGVDCDVYRPAEDRDAAWASLGLGGRHGVGIFGRVRRQKGTDLFVSALIELLPRHPDFSGIVVGLTKPNEASFLAKLKRRVEQAGLAHRIVFLGERPAAELPRLLAAVSICVAPQRYEGFGLVPLEAAACGTPVVATRVGAAPTIVEDGKTGLLVEPDRQEALTAALNLLMSDAAARAAMGAAARGRAMDEFSVEREVEAYLDVYRSLWRTGATQSADAVTLGTVTRPALAPERDR